MRGRGRVVRINVVQAGEMGRLLDDVKRPGRCGRLWTWTVVDVVLLCPLSERHDVKRARASDERVKRHQVRRTPEFGVWGISRLIFHVE